MGSAAPRHAWLLKFLAALKELPDYSSYLGDGFDPRLVASTTICPSVEYYEKSWEAAYNGPTSPSPIEHRVRASAAELALVARRGSARGIFRGFMPNDLEWPPPRRRPSPCSLYHHPGT